MGSVPLSLEQFLPEDGFSGTLVGRAWIPTQIPGQVAGPAVIAIREGGIYDITETAPTMCDLLEAPNPAASVKAARGKKIASVEDPVVKYLPEVKGSAYGVARIRDLLQMSSGTSYSEEYEDADSDIQQYVSLLNRRQGGIYAFARSFKSARPPGQKFYYASTDTEVLGALIARATGKSLSAYMSEKLWKPIGAGAPARWGIDQPGSAGREMAAGGLLIQLRDFGRFGLLFANGGKVQGKQILPEGWVEQATRPGSPQVDYGKLQPDYALGYGYQWWCLPGPHRSFTAQGIHGQFVLVDPVEHVVVVKLSNWEHAWEDPKEAETYAFFSAVVAALR